MAEPIRFYFDEHVPKAVALGLRRAGVDVLRVQEAGLRTADDPPHLERAAQEGRVLVTFDADFVRLHSAGETHSGIAFAPRRMAVGEILHGLMLIHDVLEPQEMANHVEFL